MSACLFCGVRGAQWSVHLLDHLAFVALWVSMMYFITDEELSEGLDDGGSGPDSNSKITIRPLEIVCFTCAFGKAIDDWLNERARLKLHSVDTNRVWSQIGEQRPVKLFGMLVLSCVIIVRILTLFPDTFANAPSIFKFYQVL
eukprot:1678805-Prymnesium_polylepis.2